MQTVGFPHSETVISISTSRMPHGGDSKLQANVWLIFGFLSLCSNVELFYQRKGNKAASLQGECCQASAQLYPDIFYGTKSHVWVVILRLIAVGCQESSSVSSIQQGWKISFRKYLKNAFIHHSCGIPSPTGTILWLKWKWWDGCGGSHCNPSTQEAKASRLPGVQGQTGLVSEL